MKKKTTAVVIRPENRPPFRPGAGGAIMAAVRTSLPTGTAAGKRVAGLAVCLALASCAVRCGPDAKEAAPAAKAAPARTAAQAAGGDTALGCLDGGRAFAHVERLISFGSRHVGTPGIERARGWILQTLEGYGLSPRRHDFEARTPHPELARVPMANISVDLPAAPKADQRAGTVLVGGHFDGKILPDGEPFYGANDGGSSTGLLLEMARCLAKHPPPVPVRLVWFDGEEALVEWGDADGLYGSKHMAAELKGSGEHERIAAVVIVDMIGDARLRIQRERLSTDWVRAALDRSASRLGHAELMRGRPMAVEDDHVPFQRIGIPAAVLIDLRLGPGWESNAYWHTRRDDLSRISTESLRAVGRIVIGALPELAAGPPG